MTSLSVGLCSAGPPAVHLNLLKLQFNLDQSRNAPVNSAPPWRRMMSYPDWLKEFVSKASSPASLNGCGRLEIEAIHESQQNVRSRDQDVLQARLHVPGPTYCYATTQSFMDEWADPDESRLHLHGRHDSPTCRSEHNNEQDCLWAMQVIRTIFIMDQKVLRE